MYPLPFLDQTRTAVISFATQRPQGFDPASLVGLELATRLLSPYLERHVLRRIAVDLLNTYVGPRTGPRIIEGRVDRGAVELIEAAIWFADLRGFTLLSERSPIPKVLAHLNAWFGTIVASLSRPGGHTTAVTFEYPELSAKRLEIIKAIRPQAERVLALYDPRDGSSRLAVASAREAAPKLGLMLVEREVTSRDEVIRGLDALGDVQAFLAIPGGAPSAVYSEIIEAATRQGVPTVFHGRTATTEGALANYGASDANVAREAAKRISAAKGRIYIIVFLGP
jgi:ABC transporter substrate binding protein